MYLFSVSLTLQPLKLSSKQKMFITHCDAARNGKFSNQVGPFSGGKSNSTHNHSTAHFFFVVVNTTNIHSIHYSGVNEIG